MLPEKRQELSESDLRRIFGDPPPDYELVEKNGYQSVVVPRDISRLMEICKVPEKFRGTRWVNLDFSEINRHSELKMKIRGLREWWPPSNRKAAILRSPPSRGKTTIAAAKFADVVEQIGRRALWVSWPDLIHRIRASWHKTSSESMADVLNEVRSKRFLVVDDLAKEGTYGELKPWLLEIVFGLVNHFYQQNISVIYTTEFDYKMLREKLDQAIADRINECGVWIDLSPLSNRRR